MKRASIIIVGLIFLMSYKLIAQNYYEDAEKAIKKKDYAAAMKISKECLDKDSASTALKILIQLREKDYKNDKQLFEYLGDAYAKMNVAELAITNYAEAEKYDSLDIALKFKSADLLYKSKRYKEAGNTYLRIIQLDPNNVKALKETATILFLAKYYSESATYYEKYLALEQTQDGYQTITKAFLESKNYEKAYKYAVEGLSKYPGDAVLTKYAAIASFGTQKFEDAGKYYSAIPDSLLTISDLKNAGKAFQMIKADSIAIKYYEKVIEKDSTQSGLFMAMADNYYRNNNFELAIKYYEAKINIDPTYEQAYRNMAFVYFRIEKWDNARLAFLKAKELVDTTFATQYWLGQTYMRMDSTEQAASQYNIILKLAEGKEKQYKDEILSANDFLGRRAFQKKNYQLAITYILRALQSKPSEWRFMEMLGACYQSLQNYDEAIKWYRATLKYNPKSEVAKKGLRMMSAD